MAKIDPDAPLKLTPRSFDPVTSRTMVGDERARVIEAKARADAEKGQEGFDPPAPRYSADTYMGRVSNSFESNVYFDQFKRRLERIQRIAEKETT